MGFLLESLGTCLELGCQLLLWQSDQQESPRDPVWRRDSTCALSSSDASLDTSSSENESLVDRVLLGDSSGMVVGSGNTGLVLAGFCWADSLDSSLERLPG